jgi:hypothetical protein
LPANVTELIDLVVAYAKQETVDPIKELGRWIGYGIAGAASLSLGVLLLALGGLRAIQFETYPHLSGNLSWIPYLFVVVVCAVIVIVALTRVGRVPSRGER